MGQLYVVFLRHALRAGEEDRITREGEEAARALGAKLRGQHPGAKFAALCSSLERARETARAILVGAGEGTIRDEPRLQNDVSAAFDDDWLGLEARDRNAGVNYYLHFGDVRPDSTTLAPREVAGRVAELLLDSLHNLCPSGVADSTCLVAVTHSGVTELFLGYVLGFRDVRTIGGVLDYLEPVVCRFDSAAQDGHESVSGSLIVRGGEYPLNPPHLQKLASARSMMPSPQRDDWQLSDREIYSPQAVYGFSLSPDGRQAAFIGQRDMRIELALDSGRSIIRVTPVADLCLLPMAGGYPRQLSDEGDLFEPAAWSPDSDWLAVERGGGLELRRATGGAASRIYTGTLYHPPVDDGDKYLTGPRWSPDGTALLFAVREGSRTLLRLVSRDGTTRQDLLAVEGYILGWDWSPDSRRIVLVTREEDGWVGDILLLDSETGSVRILAHENNYEYQKPVATWARHGECVVARSNISGWSKIWVLSPNDGISRQLTMGPWDDYAFRVAPDGQQLVFASRAEQDGSSDDLWLCSLDGNQQRRLTHQGGVQVPLAWSCDNRIYYWHSSPTEPGDLWVVEVKGGTPTRLTWSAPLDLERKLCAPEEVTITSDDGTRIPALVYLPAYFQDGERYPAIVWIRGGPAAVSRFEFKPFYNWLANQGYVVITPNYRGSTGYGVAHMLPVSGDGVGKHDLQDVLAAGRYIMSRPTVDLSRGVGVGGHSWGGYLALMAVTHEPEAFACAVAGAAIADWRIQQSQTEVRYYDRWLMGGWVYDQSDRARDRSPLSAAAQISVPLLVYHGEEDRDVPFAQIETFVEAARRAGVEVEYVTYPSEGHSNRLPRNQQDTLERIAAFYRKQLQPWNVRDNPSANQVQY